MVKIRCKECGKELITNHKTDFKTCGCVNNTFITGGDENTKIGGLDLKKIELVERTKPQQDSSLFSVEDTKYMEERRKRKISKKLLDSIEIR